MFEIEKTSVLIKRLKSEPNLRLLVGFERVPSEASFSRVFSFLAARNYLEEVHCALVKKAHEGTVVYHVCRDSSAIAAREKPAKKAEAKEEKKPAKKRGRPAKNAPREPKEPTVLERQVTQDAQTAIDGLNKTCAWGVKKNSQGHIHVWKGYIGL